MFVRDALIGLAADGPVKASDGSCCYLAQEGLEFAVRHLEGIEVGRILWQVT